MSRLPEKIAARIRPLRVLLLGGLLLMGGPAPDRPTAASPVRAPVAPADTVLHVRFPRPESDEDPRVDYCYQMLSLALERSGVPHVLEPARVRMNQQRVIREVARGRLVDVLCTMTTIEREQVLRPIRIPLNKGLMGVRLFLVEADRADSLARLAPDIDAWKRLRAGQGHDWPDTPILRHNGFTVVTADAYEALFRMLRAGRIDYFPRSVLEIWNEQALHEGLAVEPRFALRYPAAVYFFVHPENDALARALEQGLTQARADGSFDALFQTHYGAFLEQARLDARTIIDLENPFMPPGTPLQYADLWYHP